MRPPLEPEAGLKKKKYQHDCDNPHCVRPTPTGKVENIDNELGLRDVLQLPLSIYSCFGKAKIACSFRSAPSQRLLNIKSSFSLVAAKRKYTKGRLRPMRRQLICAKNSLLAGTEIHMKPMDRVPLSSNREAASKENRAWTNDGWLLINHVEYFWCIWLLTMFYWSFKVGTTTTHPPTHSLYSWYKRLYSIRKVLTQNLYIEYRGRNLEKSESNVNFLLPVVFQK
jgi:hypothetical protein